MKTLWFCLAVITVISIPLALFEGWMMKSLGVAWGAPLPPSTFWGAPLRIQIPGNLVDAVLLTRYHAMMFLVIVPGAIVCILALSRRSMLNQPTTWWSWLLIALVCLLGVMMLEDALFFVFSTLMGSPYPDAFQRLLRGDVSWQHYWVSFRWFQLPAFYIAFPTLAAVLLFVESRCGR